MSRFCRLGGDLKRLSLNQHQHPFRVSHYTLLQHLKTLRLSMTTGTDFGLHEGNNLLMLILSSP